MEFETFNLTDLYTISSGLSKIENILVLVHLFNI